MKFTKYLLLLLSISFFIACEKEEPTPILEVPTTYNFNNVDYSGQQTRLAMFSELSTYMKSANTSGVVVDASKMQAMFENDVANAGWSRMYDDSKQLKNKTFEGVQADFEVLFTRLATASESTIAGEPGTAGIIFSNDGEKNYIIDENGLDLPQVIEKSLMGALLYYQATTIYMGEDRMSADNEEVTKGKGTAMEHHWDEAFGYLGVPIDYPTNIDGLVYWGTYSDRRNDVLQNSQDLIDALLKGRAAISQKMLEERDEAIIEARTEWELTSVASALHYLNGGIANFEDKALALHGLSEAIGFIYSLQFNEGKNITNAQVSDLLMHVAGSDKFDDMNLYNTTIDNLQTAKEELAAIFGLESIMDEF